MALRRVACEQSSSPLLQSPNGLQSRQAAKQSWVSVSEMCNVTGQGPGFPAPLPSFFSPSSASGSASLPSSACAAISAPVLNSRARALPACQLSRTALLHGGGASTPARQEVAAGWHACRHAKCQSYTGARIRTPGGLALMPLPPSGRPAPPPALRCPRRPEGPSGWSC